MNPDVSDLPRLFQLIPVPSRLSLHSTVITVRGIQVVTMVSAEANFKAPELLWRSKVDESVDT